MPIRDLLQDALAAPSKRGLEPHRQAILELRRKGYGWREIASFLSERGVAADHTKLFRFMKRAGGMMQIPTAAQYKAALLSIKISPLQMKMLEWHYRVHNRTTTYLQLAQAADKKYKTNKVANHWYGDLGGKLGAALDFPFADLNLDKGTKFRSSSIGMGIPAEYSSCNEFQLVMHHELAKALQELGWFAD